jgi:quercetin dioxygenase-like cupin family protein
MKHSYPHKIENGSGEVITFIRCSKTEKGELLEAENVTQPGSGPPMHVHFLQEEGLTVVKGRMGAQILGQEPTYHGPGETLTFPRGVVHRFWNAGEQELVCNGWVTPVHNFEYFLTQIFDSTRRNGGERPSLFEAAFLQTKYRSEFDMVEIPRFVKAFVFPVIVQIGKLLGKYRKYANGPAPVRR